MEKPHSPSCERNQQFILDVLKTIIKPSDSNLLEIGTGTAQHAVFMAPKFSHLNWQTSDLKINHAGINWMIDDSKIANIKRPLEYQANQTEFPQVNADIVYTANTLHIMSWRSVEVLIAQLGAHLKTGANIVIYGPFNYDGKFTSESNAKFELWLKQQNSQSGIRDFESIVSSFEKYNIRLISDIEMPANNRILHFMKENNA